MFWVILEIVLILYGITSDEFFYKVFALYMPLHYLYERMTFVSSIPLIIVIAIFVIELLIKTYKKLF